jgi:hypothetical protein
MNIHIKIEFIHYDHRPTVVFARRALCLLDGNPDAIITNSGFALTNTAPPPRSDCAASKADINVPSYRPAPHPLAFHRRHQPRALCG